LVLLTVDHDEDANTAAEFLMKKGTLLDSERAPDSVALQTLRLDFNRNAVHFRGDLAIPLARAHPPALDPEVGNTESLFP
jgi:hypothetical protein